MQEVLYITMSSGLTIRSPNLFKVGDRSFSGMRSPTRNSSFSLDLEGVTFAKLRKPPKLN